MKLRIVLIFLVAILIPTALLAYFGLLAVRSERSIIERSMQDRYEFMADTVLGEIERSIKELPKDLQKNKRYLESVLMGEAAMFKGQVKILDKEGRVIGDAARSFAPASKKGKAPMFTQPVRGRPYTIAVYEHHPMFLKRYEERKGGLYLYIILIAGSVILILCGSGFTLWALSREWRFTEVKSEFVSDLSHDLRRPLTSIRMFSEMLKDGRVSSEEKKQDYYNIIHTESERLTHLANNVLDFFRIEKGRKKYAFKKENIANITTDAVEHFKTHMVEKARPVNLNIERGIPEIRMDANAISQVLTNLLSNADKFSPPDREIGVNLRKNPKDVVIEVIDQGVGVPKSERKKIFERYYRASQKNVKETEGSGLGLTLVKYTVKAHNGRVKVESEEGKGSKFSLILPI